MTEKQIVEFILKTTYTTSDLNRRLNLFREFLEYKFFTGKENVKFDDFAIERTIPSPDMMVISKWDETFSLSFTKVNVYKLLDRVKSLLSEFPVITVYLPFTPDENQILTLIEWLNKNVHPQILIDLRKNEALVLGCAFAWKGVYHDYSLHFFMEKNRNALLKLLSDYAPNFFHI